MSDRVCLGKIVAAHGIKGEVKVKSFTSNPKDVCAYGKLSNKDGTRVFDAHVVGFSKELLRVKISGVDSRNEAEDLRGTELYVSRDVLPDLEKNTFYQTDLVGLKVVKENTNEQIGQVVGVFNFGAGDILEIKVEGMKQTQMLPFDDAFVPSVDIKNGFVVISDASVAYIKDEGKDEG